MHGRAPRAASGSNGIFLLSQAWGLVLILFFSSRGWGVGASTEIKGNQSQPRIHSRGTTGPESGMAGFVTVQRRLTAKRSRTDPSYYTGTRWWGHRHTESRGPST